MKMTRLSDIFNVEYPKTLIFANMTPDSNGINFVSSKGTNNGVVAKVCRTLEYKEYPANVITVPMKGTVLWACLQTEPCYVAHQVAVLLPKTKLTINQLLYYCLCIRQNKFRYNYGRQADKTLRNIQLPAVNELPHFVAEIETPSFSMEFQKIQSITNGINTLVKSGCKLVKLSELFYVKYGVNLELNALKQCSPDSDKAINFVSRTSSNNGVSAIVERVKGIDPIPAGTISVAGGGSVLETFLQDSPYYSGRDLFYLTPKTDMSPLIKLFYCACIRANKYKYNYGRQANKTLPDIMIPNISEIPEFPSNFDSNDFFGIPSSTHSA